MNEPTSPCIEYCKVNNDDICIGCGRTIDEIARYARASKAEKERINERAANRLQTIYCDEPVR